MTQRPQHSSSSASNLSMLHFDTPDLPLILPAEMIFDSETIVAFIKANLATASDSKNIRTALATELKARQIAGMEHIAHAFSKSPFSAHEVTRSYTYLTDCIVKTTWFVASTFVHPLANPTESERLSVVAVGGYGRGEMAPFSDVDLLFLTPYKITPWAESLIETMLYILWDLKLKVGHSSRTVKDCLRLGMHDYTIRTAMLEQRNLCGDQSLADTLSAKLWSDLFSGSEKEFIEAKLQEREARHEKQGGQRYMVEPNVKEGKGGLRDLQSLFWITKYVYRSASTADLVSLNVITPEEHQIFVKAEAFLWAVRSHLHLVSGRAVETLSFDMQIELADRMGYHDRAGRPAVEIFMQDYFRQATSVGDLTRIFLTALEARHVKSEPLLERIFRKRPTVKSDYMVLHNRLSISAPDKFLNDPLNLLRLFEEALRTGLLIHPDAMRLISANLHLFDDTLRQTPEAQRIFLDLLLKHGNPERALRRMNELGALSAFIPEFEPIVAMMQFNMYHSYTVDEHTIQCIRNLAQIERGELIEELPIASSILKEGVNRKVIYVALLLHDIGKGRNEDHSVIGAQIARKVAPRLGLNKADVETVEWLVRYHLLMSDLAQKRDIADPRTVRDFVKAVQTCKRLDLLTVLTVCDIRAVGPNTWNNWKAVLIRALYRQTRRALENGQDALNRESRGTEGKKNLRLHLKDWNAKDLKSEIVRHYSPYWQGLHVTAHVVFAGLLRDLKEDEIAIDLYADGDRAATRVCFACVDHPGIFSSLAGALALVGANVVDARTYTTKDGFATAAFWIQDAAGNPYEPEKFNRLKQMINKTLMGKVVARVAIQDKDKFKKREKAFKVPTSISFDNDGSEIYTIIEVDTRDRPGLLFDLTRTLANTNVYIASAVIATYGEQVVDSFYVKDMFGLKFYNQSKQKMLERKLREAIELGVERAST